MEDFLNDWGLSVAVFLPLVGAAVMVLIPRAEEQLHKTIALLTTLAVAAVAAWGVGVIERTDAAQRRLAAAPGVRSVHHIEPVSPFPRGGVHPVPPRHQRGAGLDARRPDGGPVSGYECPPASPGVR